jgi:hypothetical protein
MRDDDSRDMEPQIALTEILRNWFRVMAALFGMFLILMGLYFAAQLFGVAYSAVTAPDEFGPVVEKWSEFLGGEEPIIDVNNGQVKINPQLFAFLALGGAGLVMLWLSMSVITTGARIVYWMGTDLDAVKRVLGSVFGPSTVQVIKEPREKRPPPFDHPNPGSR